MRNLLVALTIAVLGLGAIMSAITPHAAAQEATATPNRAAVDVFPRNLFCADITEIAPGPTWETITIGESTTEDLAAYMATISDTAGIFPTLNNTFIVGNIYTEFNNQRGPAIIFGCTIDNVITALQIHYTTYSTDDISYFTDLMSVYGEPDVATYTPIQPSITIAFWFDEGIAAEIFNGATEVDLAPQVDPDFYGRVDIFTFFAFQDVEGFEDRWPYNRTWKFEPSAPEPIGTENPFDFEAIQATVTGMPSPMPTPTFTPFAPSS